MPCLSISVGYMGGTSTLLHPILFAKYMSVMSLSPMIHTLFNYVAPIIDRTSLSLNGFFYFVLNIYI